MSTTPWHRYSPWQLFVVTAWLIIAPTVSHGDSVSTFERWYRILFHGQPIGWSHIIEKEQEQQIATDHTIHLQLRRGTHLARIEVSSSFLETADGRPIQNTLQQNLGLHQSEQTSRYLADHIEVVMKQVGHTQRNTLPLPKQPWLPPAAVCRQIAHEIAASSNQINFWTVDPTAGPEPFEVKMAMRGTENIQVIGKVVPALAWDVTTSNLPGINSRVYTDQRGRDVKTIINIIPGMPFEMVLADEQVAKAKIDPPEIVASTLVRPDGTIKAPRLQRSTVYEVTLSERKGDPQWSTEQVVSYGGVRQVSLMPPSVGVQRVYQHNRTRATVVVSLASPVPPGKDVATKTHLHASLMLNHEDSKVRDLVRIALSDYPQNLGDVRKAERIRHFVHRYVRTKDLSIGFATASEVARTAQGDCTEHSVLLAAMLRAVGIPSRTVSGLIYVSNSFLGQTNIFGYHMWVQAWLPNMVAGAADEHQWVDLDATCRTPFDSAHIALVVSAMDDNMIFNDLVKLAPWIGRISIKVIKTQ